MSTEPSQEHDVVAPGQLSNSLLDNCRVWPRLGKGSRVEQVGAGKDFHLRKSGPEIARAPFNDLRAPSLRGLAAKDDFPKFSVEHDEFPIDAERGPLLRQMDAGRQVDQPGPGRRRGRDCQSRRGRRALRENKRMLQKL